jgi:anti-anti-sigma factor
VTDRQRDGSHVTISFAGEHDVSTAQEVTQHIHAALQTGASCVCVNLDAVTFLDASILGALLRGRSHCAAHGARFVVTCSNRRTRRVFAIAKLAALLHDHVEVPEPPLVEVPEPLGEGLETTAPERD